ncbi:uncharacterized protein B0I36DRAFT_346687 [Microdochium trichocladiopsis]|uniref:C2H2-type domain-containing protein n=1 Tax=Microdochium trichocladiopsis TaxID=1682393 RepID=A0A9P9BQE6_9PEZI|nr:uncharacterized protein B0I36DRAFT_346687 [Microdochium trichocladiopsis]KAH7034798.1 hypothetical protein B0I36DRAFT_346687 [Microdochium trichocladiopsis]
MADFIHSGGLWSCNSGVCIAATPPPPQANNTCRRSKRPKSPKPAKLSDHPGGYPTNKSPSSFPRHHPTSAEDLDSTDSDSDQYAFDSDSDEDDPEWSGEQDEIETAVLSSIPDLELAAFLIVKLHEENTAIRGKKINRWQNSIIQCHGSQPPQNEYHPVGQANLHNPRKRRRASRDSERHGDSEDGDGDEQDGDEPGHVERTGEPRSGAIVKLLACPFNKAEPNKYTVCIETRNHYRVCTSGFKTIQRVKEHIERKHYPVQCDRCYMKFVGQTKDRAQCLADLAAHRQQPEGCAVGDPRQKEGISDEQWAKLKWNSGKKPSKSNNVEKWWANWDVLFPGRERPNHPCEHVKVLSRKAAVSG